MSDEYKPYNYAGYWLPSLTSQIPQLGGFLIVPCGSEAHANQIRSAMIQGGEDIYEEEWGKTVYPAYMSEFNTCELIANCLLNNPDFLDAIGDYIQNNYATSDDEFWQNWEKMQITQDNLDRVWGGCLELSEYLFERARQLLQFLDDTLDATDSHDKLTGGNGQEKPQLPSGSNWLFNKAITITKPKWITALTPFFQIGISVLLTQVEDETYMEDVACRLFQILTCLPDDTRKTENIVLTTAELDRLSDELLANPNPVIMPLMGVILRVEAFGEAVASFADISDIFRQYSIGTYQPSDTWQIICPECGFTPIGCVPLYYLYASYVTEPIGMTFDRYNWQNQTETPHEYQPNVRQSHFFGVNANLNSLRATFTPNEPCSLGIRFVGGRQNANSRRFLIETYTQTEGWVIRLDTGYFPTGGGGVGNIDSQYQWNNPSEIIWEKARVSVATSSPYLKTFELFQP